jgi:hypothetical protein
MDFSFEFLPLKMDTRSEGVQYAAIIVSITNGIRAGAAHSLWDAYAIRAASPYPCAEGRSRTLFWLTDYRHH